MREARNPELVLSGQKVVAKVGNWIKGKDYWYVREGKLRAIQNLEYRHHEKCQECALREICDGFHGDYADFYGTDEADPVKDIEPTHNHLHYIQSQDKIVEEEDKAWAL